MKALGKSTVREIRKSLGRYLAIFFIIALGVGFFAGLRTCRTAFIKTAGDYFQEQVFYDYCLVSPVGFGKDSIAEFLECGTVAAAQGGCYEDVLVADGGNNVVFRVYSIPEDVNRLRLVTGRFPEEEGECVVDAACFDEGCLGESIHFSESGGQTGNAAFSRHGFTIVGTVSTPLYISSDRGSASIGDGSITGFLFVEESCFTADYYKELYVALKGQQEIYSEAYREYIAENQSIITGIGEHQAALRMEKILASAGMQPGDAADSKTLPGDASIYVLTRDENVGYASFEQDSKIIENISVVFPVFFFLVAALVCMTTMTRMVDEQRTQIGVWKAMGYGRNAVCGKYLFYSGTAGFAGSVVGFFLGTGVIPQVFWYAYRGTYNFAGWTEYVFDWKLFAFSVSAAIFCTAGVALFCCQRELSEMPARALRPKSPKTGKRILLERFGGLWKRLGFLHKVSLRNVFRYKQRFFLIVFGISGCTALLLAGFGIRDSVQGVAEYQYGEIMLYDAEVTFVNPLKTGEQQEFLDEHPDAVGEAVFLLEGSVDVKLGKRGKSAKFIFTEDESLADFFCFRYGKEAVEYPGDGEVILCTGVADGLGARIGDTIVLENNLFQQVSVTVSGMFDNYIGNYLFVSRATAERLEGDIFWNKAYLKFRDSSQDSVLAELISDAAVGHVTINEEQKNRVDTSFQSLNLVVLLIIACAGILAFIVLFNLININIGERIREIATLKVLGFYQAECCAYVFREVDLLVAIGAILGLPFGKLLHSFVMSQVNPDNMRFDRRIALASYLVSIALTLVFAGFVKLAMRGRLKKINMAESLKSVE